MGDKKFQTTITVFSGNFEVSFLPDIERIKFSFLIQFLFLETKKLVSKYVSLILLTICFSCQRYNDEPPNIIFILTDDLGYGDLGIYGADDIKTPNINQLAEEGAFLTSYYVSQPVCSASRASILTGCYANRIGIHQALGPNSEIGIHPNEELLPELFKEQGYATAIFGKWHLGDDPMFMPRKHGFDEFYGLLYSNDMWPYHPQDEFPPLYLYGNETPLKELHDQTYLTDSITRKSIDFIKRNKDYPFFLYISHPQPHVPLFAHPDFLGSQSRGLYGDVIHEIDHSVGRILQTLQENNLQNRTMIIFTSDNGPWLSYGTHSGSSGIYREGKGTVWEGGVRVPSVIWYPKHIPPNQQIESSMMAIDWLPTILDYTQGRQPHLKIDGESFKGVFSGNRQISKHENLFFYYGQNELQAIRHRHWKAYFPHTYRTIANKKVRDDGIPIRYENIQLNEIELYNLLDDPQEKTNVASIYPRVIQKIERIADSIRDVLGDRLMGKKGSENREPGRVSDEDDSIIHD